MLMQLLLIFTAAYGSLLAAQDFQGSMVEQFVPTVCEVLKHQEEYIGRRFAFRGVVTQFEHGMYFVPKPDCAEHAAGRVQGFSWSTYSRFGGGKGIGVLATIEVKIVVRPTAMSIQKRGGPRKQVVLSVKRAYDLAPTSMRQ